MYTLITIATGIAFLVTLYKCCYPSKQSRLDKFVTAYKQGWKAREKGQGEEACPYELGSRERAHWEGGFQDASLT